MSQEPIQISFDDLTKPASQEWIESSKGQLQISEEEAKARKKNSAASGLPFLKFEGTEPKVLYFPENDQDGNINTGKTLYKIWIQKLKRSITHKTLAEFDNDTDYQDYVDEFEQTKTDPKARPQRPQFRHYVYVLELTPQGGIPQTWDMSDQAFTEVFSEYLTPEDRTLRVKKNNEGRGFIYKIPKPDELKALTATNSKRK